jgi:hypothetical protein
MATARSGYPMRIKLTDDRRALVLLSIKRFFAEQLFHREVGIPEPGQKTGVEHDKRLGVGSACR